MKTDYYESLALQALVALLDEDNWRDRFLSLTGMDGDTIKARVNEAGFLAGVLGFFLDHEPDLLSLAERLECKPEDIVKAAHALGGQPVWDSI